MVSTRKTRRFHLVSPERKRPTLQFRGFPCMETRGTPGVSLMETRRKLHGKPRYPKGNMREITRKPGFRTWKPVECTWKPQVSKGKHKGNHMETSRFPKVNIRETTWKPHVCNSFPKDRKWKCLSSRGLQFFPFWSSIDLLFGTSPLYGWDSADTA